MTFWGVTEFTSFCVIESEGKVIIWNVRFHQNKKHWTIGVVNDASYGRIYLYFLPTLAIRIAWFKLSQDDIKYRQGWKEAIAYTRQHMKSGHSAEQALDKAEELFVPK